MKNGGCAGRARVLGLLAVSLVSFTAYAGGQPDRTVRLENAVLAPCCYNEPVSKHQSEIAMKMRMEIARWVAQGRTDDEILDEYVQRYGQKVLVDPNSIPGTWSYVAPWLITAAAAAGLAALIWRWRTSAPAAPAVAVSGDLPDLPEDD